MAPAIRPGEAGTKTAMLGMPVVVNAVATSPHGTVIAGFSPSPKSMRRTSCASGTVTILPSRRTLPPCAMPSSEVFAVPGDKPERVSNPSARCVASGSAALSAAAMQSVGMTSKPTPGQSTMPAARARASSDRASSKISISPVMSR